MSRFDIMTRAEMIRELKRYPFYQERISETAARKVELEGEKTAAEAQYQRDVQPVQRKLADIEDLAIAAIEQRQPLDPAIEQQRKNLLHEIEHAGTTLALIIEDIDRRIKIAEAEYDKLRAELPSPELINAQLVRTGDPEKRNRRAGLIAAAELIQTNYLFGLRRRAEETPSLRVSLALSAISDATAQLNAEAQQLFNELTEA